MENKTKVLITGGAGYIGSNILSILMQQNYDVIVIDNFSNCKSKYIKKLQKLYKKHIKIYKFNMLNRKKLQKVFKNEKIDVVVHLAGKKYVQESFLLINEYEKHNVELTKVLLEIMQQFNVKKLVFSSSVTVYGNCKNIPVSEDEDLSPLSPYAKNKKDCEDLIKNWQQRNNSGAVILRLSNPIGANVKFMLGDDAKNKKYQGVLPYIFNSVKIQKSMCFNGNTHNTRDGTTIRDYIHVVDVATAFVKAIEYCCDGVNIFNIGYGGEGFSVLEILKEVEKQLNKYSTYTFKSAKQGDMSIFISNIKHANEKLSFAPSFNLREMVKSHKIFKEGKK